MMRSTAITLALFLALSITGCRSVNTVQRSQPRSTPNVVDPRVDIPDWSLRKALAILSVRESIQSDLRVVQVEFKNRTNRTKHFKYRVEWFDEQGMIIRSPMSGWTSRTILAKETLSLSAMAPAVGAEDFRLKLLEHK